MAKKQHIKSSSIGPAQHKQFHCLIDIHFINYEVPLIKLECPALELVESMQAAPCKQPCSEQHQHQHQHQQKILKIRQ